MKNTLSTICFLLLGAFVFTSCEECGTPVISEITATDTEWLVYGRGDSVIFENELGKKIQYEVTDSVGQTVLGEGVSPDDECYDKLDSQSIVVLRDTAESLPQIATFLYKKPSKLEVWLPIDNSDSKQLTSLTSPTYATKEVNGVTYNNVFEVNMPQLKPYSAKQILFNKEFGYLYIEFYDGKKLSLSPEI